MGLEQGEGRLNAEVRRRRGVETSCRQQKPPSGNSRSVYQIIGLKLDRLAVDINEQCRFEVVDCWVREERAVEEEVCGSAWTSSPECL
jgi:hypothetical protein